jgi:adenylosuccinate synthase
MSTNSSVTTILGAQWGDEGKGKLIDILSARFDLIARAAGGANAGHTIYIKDPENPEKLKKFIFHLIPSGMLTEGKVCLIGNGVVLHIPTLFDELKVLEENGIETHERLLISDRTHLLFEYHKVIDGLQEEMKGKKAVGTTKRGIGPCYTDKIARNGLRVHDLCNFEIFEKKYRQQLELLQKMYGKFKYNVDQELNEYREYAKTIKPMIVDSAYFLNTAIKNGEKVLIEGANGALLDIDHGTYPYVTSSNSTIGGVITGTGIAANKIDNVIGIMKAYVTRVGAGPFPTELLDDFGTQIREAGGEYGSTTGRPRRCGWFDAVVGEYSVTINGLNSINLTKLDVLTGVETLKIGTAYKYHGEYLKSFPSSLEVLEEVEVEYIEMPGWKEDITKIRNFQDLPQNAKDYVHKIEELLECKVSSIGVGVGRDDLIFC